jgi:hypothetical protein
LEFDSRKEKDFSPLNVIQSSSAVHPYSYPTGRGGYFLGGRAAGDEAVSLPTIAVVRNRIYKSIPS